MTGMSFGTADITATTNEEIASLIFPSGQPASLLREAPMFIEFMRDDDPSVIPAIARCLTTGTATGRSQVVDLMRLNLTEMRYAYSKGEPEEHWQDKCQSCFNPFFEACLVRTWCVGNVMEECVSNRRASSVIRMASHVDSRLCEDDEYDEQRNRPVDTEYWRGVAAVVLSDADYSDRDQVRRFIPWAGAHENISLVIETVSDRGTLEIDTLRLIIDDTTISPSLRHGIL